jgi:kinesin family member 5
MEMIQDLIKPENDTVLIREDPEKGVFLSGVTYQNFSSTKEGLDIFLKGDENRVTGLTKMVFFLKFF